MASRLSLVVGADNLLQQLQPTDDLNLGAWVAYTPALTTTAGTITATATGRYRKAGTTVLLQVAISITALGVGAAGLGVSLPLAAGAFRWSIPGEIVGGNTLRGSIAASAAAMTITTYAAGSPLAVGTIVLCGAYEAGSA